MRVRLLPEILVCALALLALFVPIGLTYADELDDVTSQLSEEKQRLADLESKKNQLAKSISSASASLAQVSAQLTEAETELAEIAKLLAEKEELLAQWEADRNLLIRDLYKKSKISPIEVALSEDSFAGSARQFYYYEENLDVLAEQIGALNGEISVFQENKAQAEKIKNELASLKTQYQILLSSRRSAYSSTSSQLAQVKASIQGLTAKQEQLILAKFAASATSETVGDTEPLSEPLPEPSFTPAFMAASYGIPHRVGLSQYGAYGRAKEGQSAETILGAYYSSTSLNKNYPTPGTIHVQTRYYPEPKRCNVWSVAIDHGEIPFEEYLKGIHEIPSSWSMEALKAQVVAARSYALAYGHTICSDDCCQVWKPGVKDARWAQAVDDTKGWVVIYGGSPAKTYYSSTAGGYTLSAQSVWGGSAPWVLGIKDYGSNGAYDGPGYGNSPYYHTSWGSRNCSKSEYNPWLTREELADIFNAVLLYQRSSNYTQHLSPTDGCIKDPGWSVNQVKAELVHLGLTPVNSVSAILANPDPPGANTERVYITSDQGYLDFPAATFRAVFNLRAPGYLVIKTGRFDFESR